MEALTDTVWDVVINGTGLSQSLLALALSRSAKNILHLDSNNYYGGPEAALSLQEADEWVEKHRARGPDALFSGAEATQDDELDLSFSRAYSLALAPQLIHTRSNLLSQLVSSRAYRQVEFLAVGSFYVLRRGTKNVAEMTLDRVPSTREDLFTNKAMDARSKRSLMKFLKFASVYESEPNASLWRPRASEPLSAFLESEFKVEREWQSYIVALTLSLDENVSVNDGLAAIHRHLSSMNVLGPGFAAVYPEWGGLSEVAQVGCRAGAVGGAVYMLGTAIKNVKRTTLETSTDTRQLELTLENDIIIRSRNLVQGSITAAHAGVTVSRLTAIIRADLSPLFSPKVIGAPTPSVAIIAFPAGSVVTPEDIISTSPIYAFLHSSDTGECPTGQCVVYFTSAYSLHSRALLDAALSSLLQAVSADVDQGTPKCLYRLQYEQSGGTGVLTEDDAGIVTFDVPPVDLTFNDGALLPIRKAWELIGGPISKSSEGEYMKFDDREGAIYNDEDHDDAGLI